MRRSFIIGCEIGSAYILIDMFRPQALLFDIDGTLTNTQRVVSERTKAALRRLQERGIPMAVATNRGFAEAAPRILPLFPASTLHILSGGAELSFGSGERQRQILLDSHLVRSLTTDVMAAGGGYIFSNDRDVIASPNKVVEAENHPFGFVPRTARPGEVFQTSMLALYNVPDELVAGFAALTDVHVRRSTQVGTGACFFDVAPLGHTKATGVAAWAAHVGVRPSDIMGFGDSENDLEWFAVIGHPVAMGNAIPALRERAAQVIGHTNEDGLAVYLEELAARGL